MSREDILTDTLTLADTLTALGVELPEQSRAAMAVRDAITAVVYGEDPVTALATDVQNGTIAREDATARALATLDNLARRQNVTALAVEMVLPHSRAIRRPILAAHDDMLSQVRSRFVDAAKTLVKARTVPVDATAEQAVDLDTKTLDAWRTIPDAAGYLDGIALAVLQLSRLSDTTRCPYFLWSVADSDDSAQAAEVYRDATGRGAPWHHLAAAGHTLRLATVDEAVNAAARHAERVAEAQARLQQHLTTNGRSPLSRPASTATSSGSRHAVTHHELARQRCSGGPAAARPREEEPMPERKPWATSRRVVPADWHKRRAAVLTRDRRTCYVCGGSGADEVDHIANVARGGTHDLSNLAAIHAVPCRPDRPGPNVPRGSPASRRHAATPRSTRGWREHPKGWPGRG